MLVVLMNAEFIQVGRGRSLFKQQKLCTFNKSCVEFYTLKTTFIYLFLINLLVVVLTTLCSV